MERQKPVFRLDEQLYADNELIPTDTGWWRRIEFIEAVRARPTLYYRGALGSIDSAVPLLCIGHVRQAYLLLFQAADVSLKRLLDELKRAGLSAWMKQNPELARNLADNSTQEVLTDIDRMTFIAAFRGAEPIADFSVDIKECPSELNTVRNEIAHRGGEDLRNPYYLGLILSRLLPMLDEFYQKILRLDLADFILHPIARELVVAAKYRRLANDDKRTYGNCISHLRSAYFSLYTLGESGMPKFDSKGWSTFDRFADDYIKWHEHCRSQLKHDLVSEEPCATYCKICDEVCFVTTDWEERGSGGSLGFDIQEVRCPYCRLSIDDPLLAEIHYGRINKALFGEEGWRAVLKDIGYHTAPGN